MIGRPGAGASVEVPASHESDWENCPCPASSACSSWLFLRPFLRLPRDRETWSRRRRRRGPTPSGRSSCATFRSAGHGSSRSSPPRSSRHRRDRRPAPRPPFRRPAATPPRASQQGKLRHPPRPVRPRRRHRPRRLPNRSRSGSPRPLRRPRPTRRCRTSACQRRPPARRSTRFPRRSMHPRRWSPAVMTRTTCSDRCCPSSACLRRWLPEPSGGCGAAERRSGTRVSASLPLPAGQRPRPRPLQRRGLTRDPCRSHARHRPDRRLPQRLRLRLLPPPWASFPPACAPGWNWSLAFAWRR